MTLLLQPARRPRSPSVSLTLSGNEITPAVRSRGVEGDGENPNSLVGKYSLGIWEASTNLVTNGGFETNTTGWGTYNNATLSRVTSDSKFGVACGEVVFSGLATDSGVRVTPISGVEIGGKTYTMSFWGRLVSGSGTGRMRILFYDDIGGTGAPPQIANIKNIVLTNTWQRYTFTVTAGANMDRLEARFFEKIVGMGDGTVLIDGCQIEEQPIPTPYIHTDGGTGSRTQSAVVFPAGALLSSQQGWICALVRLGWGSTVEPYGGSSLPTLFSWGNDDGNRITVSYGEVNNQWRIDSLQAGVNTAVSGGPTTWNPGDTVTVIARWSSAGVGISVNGGSFSNSASAGVRPTITFPHAAIGSRHQSEAGSFTGAIDSDLLFFAAGRGRLTDADAVSLNHIARNYRIDAGLSDLPGHPTFKWPPADGDVNRAFGL